MKNKTNKLTNFISQKKVKRKIEQKLFLTRISSLVYQKRKELKLNQKELAKQIKTSQRIISEIENGQYNMSLNFLYKLFKKLDIELISNNKNLITGKEAHRDININNNYIIKSDSQNMASSNNDNLKNKENITVTYSL